MYLLHVLRNLAVLVILTVGVLSLSPRPVVAQSSCQPLGASCSSTAKCCAVDGSFCGFRHTCCNKLYWHEYCTSSAQCCSGACWHHMCM